MATKKPAPKATHHKAIKAPAKVAPKPAIKAPAKVAKVAPKAAKVAPKAAKVAPKATPRKATKAQAPATRKGTAYAGDRNAEGRDCSRLVDVSAYGLGNCDVPRIRPPRGMATPNGFDASKWIEGTGKGCPKFAVRDTYNVGQLRAKGEVTHTIARSLCVAGVRYANEFDGVSFDPSARHVFKVLKDGATFIVW